MGRSLSTLREREDIVQVALQEFNAGYWGLKPGHVATVVTEDEVL